jgi:NADH-quinone oxidoreductase subunit G
MERVDEQRLESLVDIRASFCFENCEHGPTVKIGETRVSHCTLKKANEVLDEYSQKPPAAVPGCEAWREKTTDPPYMKAVQDAKW